METNVKVLNDCERELEVTLKYDEISNEINAAYKKEGKSISVPGFRKGKVPTQLLKKMYGDAIEYKASEDIANKKFWEITKEQNIETISAPQMIDLNFVRNEKLSFKIKYEVKPELELKDYKDFVGKRAFNYVIISIKGKSAYATTYGIYPKTGTNNKIDKNYKIEIDLQKLDIDGNPTDEPAAKNFAIDLSENNVQPIIPENAQGKKIGEKFRFSFTDEHKHGEELHKEEFHYEAEIKKIEKIVFPEENAEFFKKISKNNAASLEEFKTELRKEFEIYFKNQSEQIYHNNLLSKVVANNPFDVPKGYVENIKDGIKLLKKGEPCHIKIDDKLIHAKKIN